MTRTSLPLLAAFVLPFTVAAQTTLDAAEQSIRAEVAKQRDDQVVYLERLVNIPSGTLNVR
ncbi:MAG TPA: hypothetical protein VE861_08370, partial [Gemmatimonadaceae bacterium]|nr:hypothetical protein [Gemmatimonadaceae bacterium]